MEPRPAPPLRPQDRPRQALERSDAPVLVELDPGRAQTLGELVDPPYRFFTPGILSVFGAGCFTGLLPGYVGEREHPVTFATLRFQFPWCDGLATPYDATWNHVLFALDVAEWPAFENYLAQQVLLDTAHQTLVRIGLQELVVPDPLQRERVAVRPERPAVATLTALGLDGNRVCVAFRPSEHQRPPRVYQPAPQPKTVRYAQALFAGENPLLSLAAQEAPHVGHRPL